MWFLKLGTECTVSDPVPHIACTHTHPHSYWVCTIGCSLAKQVHMDLGQRKSQNCTGQNPVSSGCWKAGGGEWELSCALDHWCPSFLALWDRWVMQDLSSGWIKSHVPGLGSMLESGPTLVSCTKIRLWCPVLPPPGLAHCNGIRVPSQTLEPSTAIAWLCVPWLGPRGLCCCCHPSLCPRIRVHAALAQSLVPGLGPGAWCHSCLSLCSRIGPPILGSGSGAQCHPCPALHTRIRCPT